MNVDNAKENVFLSYFLPLISSSALSILIVGRYYNPTYNFEYKDWHARIIVIFFLIFCFYFQKKSLALIKTKLLKNRNKAKMNLVIFFLIWFIMCFFSLGIELKIQFAKYLYLFFAVICFVFQKKLYRKLDIS